ncbi:PhnD/SsuA/transferrin family substrate-binding protein [Psychrobacter sp. HII-4]|uniref:PhnD/SsuA/transferrin family substrate-binding protein n=1 Tax=Psychrobacter sp. HII-4 TaxID=1569264 RepID=UPI001D100E0E|nr:PhnD/SsuA/transferrin family substrate-binding protein [Psychrobacter sp. HII-4]
MYKGSKNKAVWHASVSAVLLLVMTLYSGVGVATAFAQTYYLGVLAPQGERAAQDRWQPWLDDINRQLAEDTVILVPLALENWQQQIQAKQFAFVLGPQVQFIKMNTTKWRWLATLQAPTVLSEQALSVDDKVQGFRAHTLTQRASQATVSLAQQFRQIPEPIAQQQPSAMEAVASALWVAADSNIYRLSDLQRRTVAAVYADAFGGYLLGAHLLQQNGITPSHYHIQFTGYPIERSLQALAHGRVDAAIVPLCLMEEMTRQGKIHAKQYRLLHPVATASNCKSSTAIYPNWTLAATEQAPAALVRQVSQQVFAPPPAEQMSTAGLRWLPPESSMEAERVLYEMQRHPAQKPLSAHLLDWIQAHRLGVGVLVFIILISTINYGWMSWLVWRRRQKILTQNRLIRDYDEQLRQSERFAVIGEMSGAIAHEINQPLATIQNYAQGLLIRYQNKTKTEINNKETNNKMTQNALEQIVHETKRVAAIVNNIRSWAGRSQRSAADDVRVDIRATYRQCVLLLGDKASGIDFWLITDYKGLTLPHLLLEQLLINTMSNAAQQGATNISLRCQIDSRDDKKWLALHVSDDAGGFDARQLAQSHQHETASGYYAAQSSKADGLGLGLMICQRLCKSIEAQIALSNIKVAAELYKYLVANAQTYRFRRTLQGKLQSLPAHLGQPPANTIGAQVSFYLPLSVLDKNNGQ